MRRAPWNALTRILSLLGLLLIPGSDSAERPEASESTLLDALDLVSLASLVRASAVAAMSALSGAPELDACAAQIALEDEQLAWPVCFANSSASKKFLRRLRSSELEAETVKVDGQVGVRYRPLSAWDATEKGKKALAHVPGAVDGLYEVSVGWDEELRSFRYDVVATCPTGWSDAGEFDLSAYVLAQESEFPEEPRVESPCGLEGGTYREAFLFGDGVRLQGTGVTLDGQVVRYQGKGCFAHARCARTALGSCAEPGRTVAVDPTVVPLGSSLLIEGLGKRRAEDTGGSVDGKQIDVFYGTELTIQQALSKSRFRRRVCVKGPARGG